MYVIQANACDLPNSETPLSQAQIDAQNNRVQRTGNRFVRGNQTLGDLCNGLTPPAPLPSCDDMTNSNSLLNSGPFPIPPGSPNPAAASPLTRANLVPNPAYAGGAGPASSAPVSTAPLSFDDLVAALQGGTAAPAGASPATTAPPGTLPGSNGGAVPAAAPVTAAPGGGLQICLPRMFTPAGMSGAGMKGIGARRPLPRPRRGSRGMGGRGIGEYLMAGAVRLIDGTVISDPANTTPTPAQCLPYQCGADPGNQAARYWCSYYGQATTRPPCTDPSCSPWKPSYCTPAVAPQTPAPAPQIPSAVYPYGPQQMQMDTYVPARCNGSQPAVPGGVRAGGGNSGQVCFSLASPVLWGTVAALGLAIWAASPKGGRA